MLNKHGVGYITFSPLAQGQLTERYLDGIPKDSRAGKKDGFLQESQVENNLEKVRSYASIAKEKGQSLAEMALAWTLANPAVTSTLIGASSINQLTKMISRD